MRERERERERERVKMTKILKAYIRYWNIDFGIMLLLNTNSKPCLSRGASYDWTLKDQNQGICERLCNAQWWYMYCTYCCHEAECQDPQTSCFPIQ